MTFLNDNFREYETIEGANSLNLNEWTFIKFSERRQCYMFKRRAKSKRRLCECGRVIE